MQAVTVICWRLPLCGEIGDIWRASPLIWWMEPVTLLTYRLLYTSADDKSGQWAWQYWKFEPWFPLSSVFERTAHAQVTERDLVKCTTQVGSLTIITTLKIGMGSYMGYVNFMLFWLLHCYENGPKWHASSRLQQKSRHTVMISWVGPPLQNLSPAVMICKQDSHWVEQLQWAGAGCDRDWIGRMNAQLAGSVFPW